MHSCAHKHPDSSSSIIFIGSVWHAPVLTNIQILDQDSFHQNRSFIALHTCPYLSHDDKHRHFWGAPHVACSIFIGHGTPVLLLTNIQIFWWIFLEQICSAVLSLAPVSICPRWQMMIFCWRIEVFFGSSSLSWGLPVLHNNCFKIVSSSALISQLSLEHSSISISPNIW